MVLSQMFLGVETGAQLILVVEMVLSPIFLGVETRDQIFTIGEYGFFSDIFRS